MRLIRWLAVFGIGIMVVLIALRLVGVEISNYPPDRSTSVPPDAEWAGGLDGGVWVRCFEFNGTPPQKFKCDLYGENGSCFLSLGTFQPFKVSWDPNSSSAVYEETRLDKLDYSYWDGRYVRLENGYTLKWLGH